MSHDTEEWCKILWKMTKIWWILIRALSSLKSLNFDWYLLYKLKDVWGVISYNTEEPNKVLKKWLLVWKMTWGIWQIEHFKVSRLVLSWDTFVQSRKLMNQKFTKELCVITLKNDEKSEEELTCRFKINIRNFANFDSRAWKYQEFTL